jgi:glycosyltransferase involved in cell wall biosynthesis
MKPLVSILIPAYKTDHFHDCLLSAINQTWDHIEIIVSDDSTTGDIANICNNYQDRIKYIKNKHPDGFGLTNIQFLIGVSRGEYIKFLFDDDLLSPNCVELMVKKFIDNRDMKLTLVTSHRLLIDAASNIISEKPLGLKTNKDFMRGGNLISIVSTNQYNYVGELTTFMFRKSDLVLPVGEVVGRRNRIYTFLGLVDVALIINLCRIGNVAIIPECLSFFRRHTNSNSNPIYNKRFIFVVTDWRRIIEFASREKYITRFCAINSFMKYLIKLQSWKIRFNLSALSISEEISEIEKFLLYEKFGLVYFGVFRCFKYIYSALFFCSIWNIVIIIKSFRR